MFLECRLQWFGVLDVPLMMWLKWIVLHNVYLLLPYTVTTDILLKLNTFLQRHHQIFGLMIEVKEVSFVVDLIHMLPSSSTMWFEESREADVVEHLLPVERVPKIAHGLGCRVGWMLI